jgi:hypothetical protein
MPDVRETMPDVRETVPDVRETVPDVRETVPDVRKTSAHIAGVCATRKLHAQRRVAALGPVYPAGNAIVRI